MILFYSWGLVKIAGPPVAGYFSWGHVPLPGPHRRGLCADLGRALWWKVTNGHLWMQRLFNVISYLDTTGTGFVARWGQQKWVHLLPNSTASPQPATSFISKQDVLGVGTIWARCPSPPIPR